MNQTELFRKLGAPLANARRSWGSVRPDGAVFLRVWQDRKRKHDGSWYMQVTQQEEFGEEPADLGYRERLEHLSLVRAGAPCYMVMCLAKDTSAVPRQTQSFNKEEVFVGGTVLDLDGDTWIQLADRVSIRTASESGKAH